MKKLIATLLSVLMIGQAMGAVYAEGGDGQTNIAEGKAAFSYNSVSGTTPSLAVDGDSSTYWESLGADSLGGLKDNFVIDLGASYSLSSIEIVPLNPDSAQNIAVYGAIDKLTDYSGSTKRDQNKTKLGETGAESIDGSVMLSVSGNYRYIHLEQAAGSTAMALCEVKVSGSLAAGTETSGSVTLLSRNKAIHKLGKSQNFPSVTNVVDDDPSTGTKDWCSSSAITANGISGMFVLVDLGENISMPISHVVYQAVAQEALGTRSDRSVSHFEIVGTNDISDLSTCTTLVKAGMPAAGDYDGDTDTDMWVFPIENSTPFRYVGIRKVETNYSTQYYSFINTLQVYAKGSDVAAYVESQGVDRIIQSEDSSVASTELSYTADVLNGSKKSKLIGLFTQYDDNGKAIGSAYAEDRINVIGDVAGLNLTTEVTNGETGSWDLTILDGQKVTGYISDLESLSKPAAYSGSTTGSATFTASGLTAQVSGSVDAGVCGMIMLKANEDDSAKSLSDFSAEDILTHTIATAPEGASGAWDYSFSCTMPETTPAGDYTIGLFSDSGALSDKQFTLTVYDVQAIADSFAGVSESTAVTLFNNNAEFFGSELITALNAANSQTIGKSFMLAKGGFTGSLFDSSLTNWSNINTITAAAKAAILIDATLNNTDISGAVSKYGAIMPLVFDNDDYNAEEFETILPGVLSATEPEDAQTLTQCYNRTIALSLIAEGTLAEKETALANYSDVLGIAAETLDTKYSLRKIADELSSDTEKVISDYAGGMDSVVSEIIKEFKEDEEDGGSTDRVGSGGGGGGGGIGSKVATLPRDFMDTTKETSAEAETKAPVEFKDIAKHTWAENAIKTLSERGILTGDGNGNFNPDGLLTREQAVKLLILTMNLPTSENENGYKDCDFGAWYYPYITAAKINNLVNGVSRGNFGIGQPVTRQDLSVMIYRALEKKGAVYGTEPAEFADMDKIADYAKDAVAALSGAGLINGFEDGSFGPAQNTTRAQAAVIFAGFLEMVETVTEEVAE